MDTLQHALVTFWHLNFCTYQFTYYQNKQLHVLFSPLKLHPLASHLEPALGHEKVIFDSLLPKLLGHREAHGSILVVDTTLVQISEDGVGIIDLLELLSCFGVVWVLIRVIP